MSAQNRSKKVRVFVRTRPTSNFAHDMIDLQQDGKTINIHCKRDSRRGVVNNQILDWSFRMDGIIHNASQELVYELCANDIVSQALQGYNGTLMCYGQTGAGKTFTMTGATENYKHRGIIPRSLSQLFRKIDEMPEYGITVRVSYLEIYNETMFDLLSTLPESMNTAHITPLTVVEDDSGVYVKGLNCHLATSEEDALNLLFEGETNRAISAHTLNKQSSRSHCIFTVYLESRSRVHSEARYTTSKINFVDLAGSERLGKTKSAGKTQTEAMYINKSLTFLEQVVVALADKRREHVPFRQTKLTHYLKDSIGGNCITHLIANVWAESVHIEETISTLRFATRMMCIASEAAVNESYDPAIMVLKLQKEIKALKQELAMHDTLTNRSQITYEPLSEHQKYEIKQQVTRYLEGALDEMDIVNVRQIQGVYESFKDIYSQMEKEVEDKLRAKYTLVDRTDPASIAAAQKAGVNINADGTLVGEPDGTSFGVGVAPSGARPAPSSVVNAKRRDTKRGRSKDRQSPVARGTSSPAHSQKGTAESAPHTPSGEKKEEKEEAGTPTSSAGAPITAVKTGPPPRPSTPPLRTVAFEEFKQERGSEIHRILLENKEILSSKKKTYAELARNINTCKMDMDQTRMKLDHLKAEREKEGNMFNEDGDIIISEQEYMQIKQLKGLKTQYKRDFDELKSVKSEVQYCQKLVDQCRQKLIQEFDTWYSDSFLQGTEEAVTSADAGFGNKPGTLPYNPNIMPEDEQEKFERLQNELLMENPDSAAFHNAQMRTQRRKTYEAAMRQPQPNSRKPGTPTRRLRHVPPTMLEVTH